MSQHPRPFPSVFVVCVLLWATVNALSWFAWSGGSFLALFIRDPLPPAGIGFPLLVWTSEATAESFLPNVTALLLNLLIGLGTAAVAAAFAVWLERRGTVSRRPVMDEDSVAVPKRPQYSLRSLLLATTIVAVLLGIVRLETDPIRGALMLVCLAGPGMIALSGYLTRRFGDKFSSRIALGLTVLLMVAAGVLGEALTGLADFTRALMAIFVCWTPQFVLIALGLKLVEYCWTRK